MGIDVGKRVGAFCIMNCDGDVLESGKHRNHMCDIQNFAARVTKYGSCIAVFGEFAQSIC